MAIIRYDTRRPKGDGIIRRLQTLRARDNPTSPKQPDPKADPTITNNTPQNTSETDPRFWNETSTPNLPTPLSSRQKSTSSPSAAYRKPSIAAATIIGVLVLAAITFLSIYYIRREKRARRARRLQEQSQPQDDPFGQSSLSLTAETGKALDDFLMKDVKPVRTSIMFSRSPSPSVTYVVDETERRSNRNSYNASAASLHKIETLARVSSDRTRWSSRGSDRSSSSVREAQAMLQPTGSASPRVSMSSTKPPTVRSYRLSMSSPDETTPSTTTTTESSLQSPELPSPRSSQSISGMSSIQKTPSRPDSGIFLLPSVSGASHSSHASSRLSAQSMARTEPRAINNAGGLRRSHARSGSHSHSLSQVNISPITESLESGSGLGSSIQLTPDRSTPSPMFRLSEG